MNADPLKVYIGWDQREQRSVAVADASLRKRSSKPLSITHLKLSKLAAAGLVRRPMDGRGNLYDLHSQAYCSTQFAISRFVVPLLAHSGWALFVDADVVFLDDVAKLFALADDKYAVMVVPHPALQEAGTKMDGQIQYQYSRKNESSVMLINANHQANSRLSLQDINERPGRDLHQFYWLNDFEIGYLPSRWNWLVGVEDKPESIGIAHFTLGTPETNPGGEYDHLWLAEQPNEH